MSFPTIHFSGRERSTSTSSTSSQRSNDSDQTAEYRRELRHQRLRAKTAQADLDTFKSQKELEQLKNPPQIRPKRSLTSILSTDSDETKETKAEIRKLRLKDAFLEIKQAVSRKLNSTNEQDTAREVREATKNSTIAKQNAEAEAATLASRRLVDANDELASTLKADEQSKQAKHLSETAEFILAQARAEQEKSRESSTSNLRVETVMVEQKALTAKHLAETAKHLAEAAQQKLNKIRTTVDTDLITDNKDSLAKIGKQSLENRKTLLKESEKDIRQGREGRRQAWAEENRGYL